MFETGAGAVALEQVIARARQLSRLRGVQLADLADLVAVRRCPS